VINKVVWLFERLTVYIKIISFIIKDSLKNHDHKEIVTNNWYNINQRIAACVIEIAKRKKKKRRDSVRWKSEKVGTEILLWSLSRKEKGFRIWDFIYILCSRSEKWYSYEIPIQKNIFLKIKITSLRQ
jgi:hypothetical protein